MVVTTPERAWKPRSTGYNRTSNQMAKEMYKTWMTWEPGKLRQTKSETERVLQNARLTGLMQVLPGHPLADPRRECQSPWRTSQETSTYTKP